MSETSDGSMFKDALLSKEKEERKTVVAILSPDEASGKKFTDRLITRGVDAISYHRSEMPPRVMANEDGENRLTEDREPISRDIAEGIKMAIAEGHQVVSIACNTVSLEDEFVNRAMEILKAEGYEPGRDFVLVTTLGAMKKKYAATGVKPPIFLGTTPLSQALPVNEFDTLANNGHKDLQDLVQEIIWRVKGVHSSDVKTAPQYAESLVSSAALDAKILELAKELKNREISELIMGCTELPMAFDILNELDKNHGIQLIDPADIVAEETQWLLAQVERRDKDDEEKLENLIWEFAPPVYA